MAYKWCTGKVDSFVQLLYIMMTAKVLLIDAFPVAFITSKKIRQISSLKATSSTVLLPPYWGMWDLSKKFDVTVEQGNDKMIMQSDLLAAVLVLQCCVQFINDSSSIVEREIFVINSHSKSQVFRLCKKRTKHKNYMENKKHHSLRSSGGKLWHLSFLT